MSSYGYILLLACTESFIFNSQLCPFSYNPIVHRAIFSLGVPFALMRSRLTHHAAPVSNPAGLIRFYGTCMGSGRLDLRQLPGTLELCAPPLHSARVSGCTFPPFIPLYLCPAVSAHSLYLSVSLSRCPLHNIHPSIPASPSSPIVWRRRLD